MQLVWAAVLVLCSATGAHAQQLLTTDDGISLRGTVRLLQSNAATCNVIAENAQGSYEEMRVNQGQPLHLWELEFSVFNGSGRALDHLIAYYDIASPWPPCTNWTENYELEGDYVYLQVQWFRLRVVPHGEHLWMHRRGLVCLVSTSGRNID